MAAVPAPGCSAPPPPAPTGAPLVPDLPSTPGGRITKQIPRLVPQVGPPRLTGPAVVEFGAARVAAAYKTAIDFTVRATTDPTTLMSKRPTRATLCYVLPSLTPDGVRRLYDAIAGKGTSPDSKLYELVEFHGSALADYVLRPPYTRNTLTAAPLRVGIWPTRRSWTGSTSPFAVGSDLLLSRKGKALRVPVDREARFFMVPDPGAVGGLAGRRLVHAHPRRTPRTRPRRLITAAPTGPGR